MNTLIIYAHPNTPGHNPQILEEVKRQLASEHKTYEVLDLYHMQYDPILREEELRDRAISKETQEIQEKIRHAKHLIIIYPIWWGTMPAILKGFMDKVMSAGFAFKYVNRRPQGLLKGKTAAVFITSGSPKIFQYLLGHRYSRSIKTDILGFCGIKTKVFHIDNAVKLTDKQEEKIRKEVKKGLQWLY